LFQFNIFVKHFMAGFNMILIIYMDKHIKRGCLTELMYVC
jgi:hypothetical protein